MLDCQIKMRTLVFYCSSTMVWRGLEEMIIECIDKYGFEMEIERIIHNTSKGNCDDILTKLQYLLSVIKKYAADKGVRIVIQQGVEMKELLVPYFDLLNDDCFTAVATFGMNTPIVDIYDLYSVVTRYSRENVLIANPDQSLNEEMVMLLIPLKSYYELMLQFDHKLEQLKSTNYDGRGGKA